MAHEQIREVMEYVIGVEPSLHNDSEALPTEFVDDGQYLDRLPIVRTVCHEIISPDMIAVHGPEADA